MTKLSVILTKEQGDSVLKLFNKNMNFNNILKIEKEADMIKSMSKFLGKEFLKQNDFLLTETFLDTLSMIPIGDLFNPVFMEEFAISNCYLVIGDSFYINEGVCQDIDLLEWYEKLESKVLIAERVECDVQKVWVKHCEFGIEISETIKLK